MLIQHGVDHKKLWGRKLHIKAPDFHKTFGAIQALPADFNLDAGLTNFDQNAPNPVFSTPAQPEGCTGMTDADVNTDNDKTIYSPYWSYQKNCLLADVPLGQPVDLVDALNSPSVYGLQALGETDVQATNHKKVPYKITSLNNSLFFGIVSAMVSGGSVSFAGDWYESFDSPVNGIVPLATGQTSGHNWKFCGLKTVNAVPYLIAKPWLGQFWGEGGFCYFSEGILDGLDGSAFTFAPATNQDLVVQYDILSTIISFLKRLIGLEL